MKNLWIIIRNCIAHMLGYRQGDLVYRKGVPVGIRVGFGVMKCGVTTFKPRPRFETTPENITASFDVLGDLSTKKREAEADRDRYRLKIERLITNLRADIHEARLSHTCDNCPPSVTVADIEATIEEVAGK